MIDITIKGKVPSKSNAYKIITLTPRGKRPRSSLGKTKELKAYEKLFDMQLRPSHRLGVTDRLTAQVDVYFESERPDLDNAFKIIFDCLQNGSVIKNDRQIRRIVAERFKDKHNPRVEIRLTKYRPWRGDSLFVATVDVIMDWLKENAPPQIREAIEALIR